MWVLHKLLSHGTHSPLTTQNTNIDATQLTIKPNPLIYLHSKIASVENVFSALTD